MTTPEPTTNWLETLYWIATVVIAIITFITLFKKKKPNLETNISLSDNNQSGGNNNTINLAENVTINQSNSVVTNNNQKMPTSLARPKLIASQQGKGMVGGVWTYGFCITNNGGVAYQLNISVDNILQKYYPLLERGGNIKFDVTFPDNIPEEIYIKTTCLDSNAEDYKMTLSAILYTDGFRFY